MKKELQTDFESLKGDMHRRPAGAGGSSFGITAPESPLKKIAFGLTSRLSNEIVNKALSSAANQQKQDVQPTDLEPILKMIQQLSE